MVGSITGYESFLAQPLVEEISHLALQSLSSGSEMAGRSLPGEPVVVGVREAREHGILAHKRRADVVPAQDHQLVQRIVLLKILGTGNPFCRVLSIRKFAFLAAALHGQEETDCQQE